MPLGESFKNTLYYKNEDGEYKELNNASKISTGISIAVEGISEYFKEIANEISNSMHKLSFNFEIKHISRKKIKKMLMGKRIQRNEAEKIINEVWKQKKYFTLFDLMKY